MESVETKPVRHYIILRKHLLFGLWFIAKEIDCSEEEMVQFMQGQDPTSVKVVEGDFVKFKVTTVIDNETKEEIFRKHSQGSVFEAKATSKKPLKKKLKTKVESTDSNNTVEA